LYRGVYEWDDPVLAEAYARPVARPGIGERGQSIHYAVLPELGRDELLADPHVADSVAPDEPTAWWRVAAAPTP
jgi:hypothetical protein